MSKCNKCWDESSSDESCSSNQCKCRDCTNSSGHRRSPSEFVEQRLSAPLPKYQSRCKKISRCREVNENKQNCKYCKQSCDTVDTFCSRERSCTERPNSSGCKAPFRVSSEEAGSPLPHSNCKSKSTKKCQVPDYESALSVFNLYSGLGCPGHPTKREIYIFLG